MTAAIGLEGMGLAERALVARLVERLRAGGFEMLLLRQRLLRLLANAAQLAGDHDEARQLECELEQLVGGIGRLGQDHGESCTCALCWKRKMSEV